MTSPQQHDEFPRVPTELGTKIDSPPPRRLSVWVLERLDMVLLDRTRSIKKVAAQSKKKRATHTSEELRAIEKAFGPGADVALKSIQRSIGYKVTVEKG